MPSKIPNDIYFHENYKDGSKSLEKYDSPRIHKAKTKNKAARLILPTITMYLKAILVKQYGISTRIDT